MKYVILFGLVIASAPLSASIPVEQALELCRAEQNALRRLTCYDAITLDGSSDASPAVTIANPAQPKVQHKQPENFGLEHKKAAEDNAEQLTVTVKSVSYSPHKELIIELNNGQRWRQVGTDYYSISAGQQHIIKRGLLNSFYLANDSNNRTIRVRREQ
jgi:hypothetical protein